ncbi:hypothetical protein AALO_G00081410 [Alosa alosa]|uniref:Uncharacterized protein n=1 Tax=Alosa alosa TaxID=278164 RepID=A0AAV6H1Z5_9TELE|nr:hypothetical protein AALO_G00081410 [Alosa alosa]
MLDGTSRMGQPLPDWSSESRVSTVCCCSSDKAVGWDDGSHGLSGQWSGGDLTTPGLRPPPLFRALGLRGASSASLPPHRRLRSMFQRPRAVLPDSSHQGVSSWKDSSRKLFTFGDAHVSSADCNKSHSNSAVDTCKSGPLESSTAACDRVAKKRVLLRTCSHPEVLRSDEGKERETRSLSLTGMKLEVPPQCPPVSAPSRGRGRRSSSVFPESWTEHSGWRRERPQAERKRRSRGRPWDTHKSAAASVEPEGHQEAGLCQWLQSLGFAEDERSPPTRRIAFGGELQRSHFEKRLAGHRGGTTETGTQQTHQRRDRRPHFLPPIPQSTSSSCSSSLLNVPLLLPENSPPPSRCVSPESPCSPLPVPLLTHIPLPPRKRRDFKTLF